MATNYDRARAVRTSSERDIDFELSKSSRRKATKTIKKSPLLIIIAVTLIVGIVGGFFLMKGLSKFEMNDYLVNGVASIESDYVVVDMTAHKESLVDKAKKSGDTDGITTEELYENTVLEDTGVTIKFLGMDIKDSLKTKYYYREDISHDITEVGGIDITVPGVYYIEYTSTHFAYKNVTLIRTIIVTGVEVDG